MARWLPGFLSILLPACLMFVLGLTPGISFQEDLGRHLLLGRLIVESGFVPGTNLLSYTHPDFAFVNHHWLSEVGFYQLHLLVGYQGLILFKALVMSGAIVVAMLAVSARRISGISWFAVILACILIGSRPHIRPELVSFLCVPLLLCSFEGIRRGVSWPWGAVGVLMWVWTNAHISFMFGFGMVGAFLLERFIVRCLRESRIVWQALPTTLFGVAMLAVLCSLGPNGIHGFLYPFRILGEYGVDIVENFSPLHFWRDRVSPELIALPCLFLLSVFAIIMNLHHAVRVEEGQTRRARLMGLRWADMVTLLAAMVLSLWMMRHVPFLGLCCLPVIHATFSGERETKGCGLPRGWPVAMVVNICLILLVVEGSYSRRFAAPVAPTPFGLESEPQYEALHQLAADGLSGPIFNDFNVGSLVSYNMYPQPVFADNRPEAYPESFWREEVTPALRLGPEWDTLFERHEFNCIILSLTGVSPETILQLVTHPEWIPVHVDSLCVVFVLNHPRNAAFLAMHALDEARRAVVLREVSQDLLSLPSEPFWRRQTKATRIMMKLYGLFCIGEGERVALLAYQLHLCFPDYQQVHELLLATIPYTNTRDLTPILLRAARYPVSSKQSHDLAWLLRTEGRIGEADRALKHGRLFFPFQSSRSDSQH
ncbi:MAG: hypothetical protein GY703_10030 [Gammaproteobacteria bacterium]|nr:hypothetical protein [Gammaproteobacteria bacterium]